MLLILLYYKQQFAKTFTIITLMSYLNDAFSACSAGLKWPKKQTINAALKGTIGRVLLL